MIRNIVKSAFLKKVLTDNSSRATVIIEIAEATAMFSDLLSLEGPAS